MTRKANCFVLVLLACGYMRAQTPGQVPIFDQPGTGACNNAGGNDCVDSVISQAGGNIGIGTTTPAAKLDVVGGNLNLENSTASSGSILKGGALFLHNFGNANTFLGFGAGNLTMSGPGANTAVGMNTLLNNSLGSFNTATGMQALYSNTEGAGNTASGVQALYSNTSGNNNTASGTAALYNNATGNDNTASGSGALQSNTTGPYNTAIGSGALQSNTTGDLNAATGYQALGSNTTGIWNTASGARGLQSNTTGSGNTAVGVYADVSQGDLSNATAIGNGAIVNASNKIRLGNTGVTVVEGPPYSTVSDKNAKENFKPVDAEEVLQKVRAMNVSSWNYIGQDAKQFRHYGPVAQDFFAAFGADGVGTIGSPTTITSTDMNGVLMLAIQALGRENTELKTRIESLERLVKGK